MKTAEELYNKHKKTISGYSTGYQDSYYSEDAMKLEQFKLALTEYRQSIIGLIDEMILENGYNRGQVILLNELKQKILKEGE